MMDNKYLLGLPPIALNCLSGGLFVFIVCLGIRVVRAPEMELKVANTQLVVGGSAEELKALALKLDEQAKIIEDKEEAYRQLQLTYEQSLGRLKEDRRLTSAFKEVEELPKIQNIEEIQQQISETKKELSQVLNE